MTAPTSPYLTISRDDIIGLALGKIRVFPPFQPIPASNISQAAKVLNFMVSEWRNLGFQLWKREMNYLFPVAGQANYKIYENGDNWTQSYVSTSVGTAAAQGATSITVASIANINSGDNIGIVMDNGTRYWTTVNGAPSGNTINIAGSLPTTSAAGNMVYAYTTKAYTPLKIYNEGNFRRQTTASGQVDIPLLPYSYSDYQRLPNKNQSGTITGFMFDYQLSNGFLNTWLAPTLSTDVLGFSCQMPFLQFQASNTSADLPQQFYQAMVDGLAAKIQPYYKPDLQERQVLQAEAAASLKLAMDFGEESVPVQFQPLFEGHQ